MLLINPHCKSKVENKHLDYLNVHRPFELAGSMPGILRARIMIMVQTMCTTVLWVKRERRFMEGGVHCDGPSLTSSMPISQTGNASPFVGGRAIQNGLS